MVKRRIVKYHTCLRESFTLTLIVLLLITPTGAAAQETYTEGDIIPVILLIDEPINTAFTVKWEVRLGSAEESDFSVTFYSNVITPADGLRVHLGDIQLIDDDIVEGPETFSIHITGVFTEGDGTPPKVTLSLDPPKRPTIVNKGDRPPTSDPPDQNDDDSDHSLTPDPPYQNNNDAGKNRESQPEKKKKRTRRRISYCLAGWKKSDVFGKPTKRVIFHAVEVAIDIDDWPGMYKPVAIEIYADPTEGLIDLHGWKLTMAPLYNYGKDYLLTAENSTFDENGIARIESPSENPFPMNDIQFIGQWLPGFDYRLLDANNMVVDFGLSCYRHGDLQERLLSMEIPRVERDIIPPVANDETLERVSWRERLDWKNDYYLSIWWVPTPAALAVAGAPTAVRKPLTTSWAVLKKAVK